MGQARDWDDLALVDPFWAVLAADGKRGGGWELSEFLSTGEADVEQILATATQLGRPSRRERVLDFGCGVGRLTQALAGRFDEVDGVDIAPSMIELAERLDRSGGRCHYHLSAAADLAIFGDDRFDLVCSLLVLQHVEAGYARGYLREFLRVLRPGGVLVAGLPSHPAATLRGLAFAALPNRVLNLYRRRRYGYQGVMELHGLRRAEVVELLESAGGEVVAVVEEPALGADWHAFRYCAVKRAAAPK